MRWGCLRGERTHLKIIPSPKILFADEPTGNLDEETAKTVTDLLFKINKEEGTTLVLVTHNLQLAENTNRILQLKGGKLISDQHLSQVQQWNISSK